MTAGYRDGSVMLPFADGDYKFRLAWGQLGELQEKCNAGPYVILDRLLTMTARIEDIAETIRLGLIGGGASPFDANKLVSTYVKERPLGETIVLAQQILGVAVVGAPEEEVEKKSEAPAQNQETNFQTESSEWGQSTASGL